MALLASGCAMNPEQPETESVGQAEQALSSSATDLAADKKGGGVAAVSYGTYSTIDLRAGATLSHAFPLSQNCTLTAWTTAATSATDPVFAIVINNGNPHPWGSANEMCHHSPYNQVDGYNTLAFNDDYSGRNPRVSWKNPNGGNPLTVYLLGSLYGSSPTYGYVRVYWTITGCNDTSKNGSGDFNQIFNANGAYAMLPGNVVTAAGAAPAATDPTLYEVDPAAGGSGNAKCDDDCASSGSSFSCIPNNSGASMWYFAQGWYGTEGNIVVHN